MKNKLILFITRYLLVVIIILRFFCCQLWGLDPDKGINQYLVDQWGMSAGIPSNSILSIAQTPDGYLWFATLKGLVRFDGIIFREMAIHCSDTAIPIILYVDREGILWMGSTRGLACYDWKTGKSKTFTPEDGIIDDRILTIKEDVKGNLWISIASNYVSRLSNGKFTSFNESHGLSGKKINAVIEDRSGNLLFGSREEGVFLYKDEKFSEFSIAGVDNEQIISMYEDRKEELWIGTMTGLFRVIGGDAKKYTTDHGLSHDYISVILEDSERNLWVGTLAGLNRIKRSQDGKIGFESVLESSQILSLFEDSEKSLWVGTDHSGVKRLKDGIFTSYESIDEYRQENFLSLFEDRNGNTWLGSLSGKLFRFLNGEIVEVFEHLKLSGTGVAAIAEDGEGNLWLGTNGKGVFQKKHESLVQFTTRNGLADNFVTSIFKDSRDNLWFSTMDGVSVLRSAAGRFDSLKPEGGLSGKVIHNVYEDRDQNIWIAADRGITVLKDGKLTQENRTSYLQGITVTCIYEESESSGVNGSIFWIATYGKGLKRFRHGKFSTYTTAEGISSNFIYQFFEDKKGYFWLMSDNGMLRVSKHELENYNRDGTAKINCRYFGLSDGLKSHEFNNQFSGNSALKARNGEFWFITKKGVSIVNPAKILIDRFLPRAVIEAVFLDEQPFSIPAGSGTPIFRGIKYLRFHFTAPTFLSPEKVKFRYRMAGYDRQEILLAPGAERAAHYRDVPPGKYAFKVIACNVEGACEQTGTSFTFILKPLFYQTFLFKIAVLFFLLFISVAAFYIYKKHPFKEKAKYKGSTLHHEYAEECIAKLKNLVEVEKVYEDSDLTLQSLAQRLSLPPHLLSQILNERLKRNFADFINFYRIEEAKRLLKSPEGAEQKIDALAVEVGFNTMVAFYRAFKKYTGMTPTQYKKKVGSQ